MLRNVANIDGDNLAEDGSLPGQEGGFVVIGRLFWLTLADSDCDAEPTRGRQRCPGMTTHAMVHSHVVTVDATANGIESAKNGPAGPPPTCLVLTADGSWLQVSNPDCGPLPVAPAIPPIAPPPPAPEIAQPDPGPDPGGRRRHRVPRLRSRA